MAALITVDWGTTSFRAALHSDGGAILDHIDSTDGILSVSAGAFEATLLRLVSVWNERAPSSPIVMSGMIGSRQGWQEAPYLRCPADSDSTAAALVTVPASSRIVRLVPGIDTIDARGVPDVMRGEETQVFGAIAGGASPSGLFVLPGTHSKWVTVDQSTIIAFKTYMTGEAYAALRQHTILARLMADGAASSRQGFAEGVRHGAEAGGPGALLTRVFATRTLGLFDRLPAGELADYLSGLLIGAELADAVPAGATFTVIGSPALTERYATAASLCGRTAQPGPPNCAARGAFAIARRSGLVTP
jgi:2-dehydro-3-deoxygalactonokinase